MGKKVIVSGAAGFLGRIVVSTFLESDYEIIALTGPDGDASILGTHPQLEIHQIDLTREKQTEDLIRTIIRKHKRIDAALMLAGGFDMGTIKKTKLIRFRKMLGRNFETAFNVARPLFHHMCLQEGGGRLVFVGARPVLEPEDGTDKVAYTLSKSLLFNFGQLLNAEGRDKQVVASVIVPSIIDTPANREAMPDADFTAWVNPLALASIMKFLCSDAGKDIREPVIKVYGDV